MEELKKFSIKIGTTTIKVEEMQTLVWKKPCEDEDESMMKSMKPSDDHIKSVIKSETEKVVVTVDPI